MTDPAGEQLRLPWTGEFTPGQLGKHALDDTLAIVAVRAGNRDAIVETIRQRWFADAAASRPVAAERLKQQRTRSGNVLNGMQRYGLVTEAYRLTDLGAELAADAHLDRRTDRFVDHLLRHGQGLELLDAVRDLQQRRVPINKRELVAELRRRGYWLTTNSGDPGKLRQWLGTAGVVDKRWVIDEARIAEITGTSLAIIGEWQSLTRVQRAFLGTIRRLGDTRGRRPIPSPELLDFVREEHGPIFDESQVGKVYSVLSGVGWIDHSVKASGRGGKGGTIAATDKLLDVDLELLVGFRPGALPADLRAVMTTPLENIFRNLQSEDTYVKGIALELLTVNLASDLGLTPLRLRVRGVRTGGAEVDLVAEASHLHFSRWLFQCKNTRLVDVGVLAKEVGMATLLQAQVIVIATTGTVSKTVTTYAKRVCETTPYQVALVEKAVLEAYQLGGAPALRQRFHHDAQNAMRRKRPQVLDTLDELAEDES
ncbi:MAG: restriction endonuclease [Acidimicrobiales bacterium]